MSVIRRFQRGILVTMVRSDHTRGLMGGGLSTRGSGMRFILTPERMMDASRTLGKIDLDRCIPGIFSIDFSPWLVS